MHLDAQNRDVTFWATHFQAQNLDFRPFLPLSGLL
jgi:hypothetical protein